MKKTLLRGIGSCVFLMLCCTGFAQVTLQNLSPADPEEKCGSAIIHQQRMQNDPAYAQMHMEMEEYIANYVPPKVDGQYRVPIVVHVVYYTTGLGVGIQNISDDQIREAVRVLNERFRNIGNHNNASGFDIDIEFALAVRDPAGNCTNGITRENVENWSANGYSGWSATVLSNYQTNGVRALGSNGITDAQIKAVNQWPSNQYFNIWLIPEFDNNGGGNGVQGYASFATSHGTTGDGSVMLGLDFINENSTTFTHELGHSFNLYHTFQGDDFGCPTNTSCNTQGDMVCDTPPHERSNSDCDAGGNNSCTNTSNSLFVYNYMDYSSCGDRFTAGQRTRMQAAITGTRASFLASSGNNKLVPPSIPATPTMKVSKSAVCIGESLQLFDATSCIPNDYLNQTELWPNLTFAWVITNGTETINSDRQNPVITPTTAGTFNVTLTITHATLGTITTTTNGLFVVVPNAVPACTPTSSNAAGNYGHTINKVTFNTLNSSTDPIYTPIYANMVCDKNTVVTENVTYQISITTNTSPSGSMPVQVMIDWNNDGTFNDAGEGWGDINGDGDMVDAGEGYLVTGTVAANTDNQIVTGNILIPTTAVENVVLRMRVIGGFSSFPTTAQKNCTSSFVICDIEDYGVVVKSVSCVPVVTTQPTSSTICQNGNATFTAAFSNTPTSYIWQVSTNGGGAWTNLANGAPYSNVTTASMTITGATLAMNSYQYRCVATNGCGSGNSNAATLTVNTPATPTFANVGPYCSGASIPALPTTSTNGISGTWSPAINNTATTTYTFTPTAGQCATTTTKTITINPNVTPTFAAVGPYCSGASIPALPTTSTNGINGTWSPAINNTATTTYTFTPTAGQCATTTTKTITINPNVTPTFANVGPYCSGASIPALPTTSTNGINGTWSPAINNTATTTYTFTPTAGQCATTTTKTITINPNVTPTFAAVGPYCSGASIPALPTTSTNGISGTWSPAINNTATTTYTFTPAAGQCATTTTLTIVVNATTTATFGTFGPYCSGASVPALPTTSTNGISGTWSPAINNTATTTYTFTPAGGQCSSTTVTTTITINPNVTPAFAAVGPYCSGASIPALPTTSTNGINGTWSPAINNTATTTYTFTPAAGQCATTTTKTITINPNVTPTFAAVGPYCSGASIPALPTTSTNGINGTWSPAINNTTTTTYTFTPAAGQCATTTALTITVNPNVTPTFSPLSDVCQNAAAPSLAGTSTNGISGTWSPASFSTATAGTFTSTFTPSAGQCAVATTISLTVDPTIVPTFAAVPHQCLGATPPALPTTSTNGVSGTWSPATINTSAAGTTAYTFTPSAGQCSQTVMINVTVGAPVAPTFTQIAAFCAGSAAPSLEATSTNGISGTWSPATVSNAATGTYTFTPNAGECATTTSMTITVNQPVTPSFNAIPAFCSGMPAPALPTSSTNEITGSWLPPVINNTASGTYVFTPAAGQCATTQSLPVTVNANPTVTFGTLDEVCVYDAAVVLIQGAPAGGSYSGTGVSGGQFNPATAGLGTFNLTYAYTDGNGCSGSAQTPIVVSECLGLEDNELTSVNVFPNPSSGNLVVDAGTAKLVSIAVYDRLGKLVLNQETGNTTFMAIDLSFAADGVYTLRIVTETGTQHLPVFIKK